MDKPQMTSQQLNIDEQLRQQTEQNLIMGFNMLTDEGKGKLLDYAIDLLSIGKYRKDGQTGHDGIDA